MIPLAQARICVNCDVITDRSDRCPKCDGDCLWPLTRWFKMMLDPHTENWTGRDGQ